jgi:hypothetical protein
MEKIPTAEAFLIDKGVANPIGEIWRLDLSRDCYVQTEKDIHTAMIDFAKLHVEAALKEASLYTLMDFEKELKDSYPLENIK